ncbi:MAG TPA: hypothetical protein VH092_32275 [Urbifossiella sp.]|nr:hypothetical protein [Urbifossiella sp.]
MTAPGSFRRAARAGLVAVVACWLVPAAGGYIHFPPPTLEKMCAISRQIRAIKVERVSPDGEVVLFEPEESLKGEKALCEFRKHVLRGDPAATKPFRNALKPGAGAVMFWIEGAAQGTTGGCGYVFLDRQCYSVDYNAAGKHWVMIRPEPGLSACYHGPPEQLRGLVRDVLAGKKVGVPVKAPDRPETKAEWEKRYKEVNDVLNANRKRPN